MTRSEFLSQLNIWIAFGGLAGFLTIEQVVYGRPPWAAAYVGIAFMDIVLACWVYFDPKCRAESTEPKGKG